MRSASIKALAAFAFMSLAGCAHTEGERQQSDFVKNADKRISQMESTIVTLEKRADEQLPGAPRQRLVSAVDNLKAKTIQARNDLKDLKDRDATGWVEKKPTVDRELYEMDGAYNEALGVFAAH